MKVKHCLSAVGLLLVGASATAMIATDNQPATRSDATFEISFKPTDGATVKQLQVVNICIDMGEDFFPYINEEKVSSITLTKEGGEPVSAESIGEIGYEYGTTDVILLLPVNFPVTTEEGTYILNVPEGVICEGDFDSNTWEPIPIEGGLVNAATTATFTIDSTAKGILDNYSLIPEAGSNVATLNDVQIAFPDVEAYADMWQSEDSFPLIATNGETTCEGFATQDWNSDDCKVMNISFTDEETLEYVTFTSGIWTLTIPAGAFTLNGDVNPEIIAEYNVIAPSEEQLTTWNTFPVADSDVKQLNAIKLMYLWNDSEASINVNEELLSQVNIIKEDGNYAWTDFEIGEPTLIMNDMVLMVPLMFDAQTEAGKYEVRIPRGLLYQTKYNEETGNFGVFAGYQESAAQSFYFNIDPEMPGILEDITMAPEAGGTVQSLDKVILTFNSIPSYLSLNMLGFDEITLTNGETTYTGVANLEDPYFSNIYCISFVNDQDEVVSVGAGDWTLTIPSGYFMFEGNQSPEIIAEYTVMPIVLTPAPGATLSEITYFEVAFPGANKVEFVGAPYMITLMSGQSAGIPAFDVVEVEGAEVPTFKMTPIEGYAEPKIGNLLFSIEEGAFLIDGEDGQTEGNSPRVRANYYYVRPISEEYLPEPNAEEVLCQSWGYTVGFVFDNAVSPSIVNTNTYEGIEVKFDDTVLRIGSEYACYEGDADCAWSVMDNILSFFVVNPEFHKAGTISVSMRGDSYTLSGNFGFDIEHSWRVVMPQAYEFTLTPDGSNNEEDAAVVSSLEEITLIFENAETAEVFRQSGVSLRKTDYSVYVTADIVPVEGTEHPTFNLVFTPDAGDEFSDGMYKLQISYDTFTLDGVQGWPSDYTDIERMYKLDKSTGVDNVDVSGNIVTVVTTDGRVVLKNASGDSLNTLDNGIYIVNGKKVVINN